MNSPEQTVRLAGQPFGVRCSSAEFRREFSRILQPFGVREGAAPGHQHYEVEGQRGFVLSKGRRQLFRCRDLDDALEYLEAEIYGQLIRLLDGPALFHAAAAVAADTLILLPAAPRSGKTTLVAGLIKRGALYVTDEMLIVCPDSLRVENFPKPLNLKYGSLPVFPTLGPEFEPARRGPLRAPQRRIHHMVVQPPYRQRGPIEPRRSALLFPAYCEGAEARLQPVERVEAIRRLAAASYNHYRFDPAQFLSVTERLTRGALCAELRYGSLDEALELIHRNVSKLEPRSTCAPA